MSYRRHIDAQNNCTKSMSYSVFRLHALFSVLERPLVCQLFNPSSWYCITKGKMKWDRKIVYILANTLYIYSRIEHILERNVILYFKLSKSGMEFYYIFRNETLQYSCTDKYQFGLMWQISVFRGMQTSMSADSFKVNFGNILKCMTCDTPSNVEQFAI